MLMVCVVSHRVSLGPILLIVSRENVMADQPAYRRGSDIKYKFVFVHVHT